VQGGFDYDLIPEPQAADTATAGALRATANSKPAEGVQLVPGPRQARRLDDIPCQRRPPGRGLSVRFVGGDPGLTTAR
jgi:hypothetical protein